MTKQTKTIVGVLALAGVGYWIYTRNKAGKSLNPFAKSTNFTGANGFYNATGELISVPKPKISTPQQTPVSSFIQLGSNQLNYNLWNNLTDFTDYSVIRSFDIISRYRDKNYVLQTKVTPIPVGTIIKARLNQPNVATLYVPKDGANLLMVAFDVIEIPINIVYNFIRRVA